MKKRTNRIAALIAAAILALSLTACGGDGAGWRISRGNP